MVTYNQEKYIAQCLQSIVDQVTDFDFEVIVGDDCSTDGTREVVQAFAGKNADLIKPIFHSINVGFVKNYVEVHKAARGEFVAHIDGDDYCLQGKLQKQADFLDSNKDLSSVVHVLQLLRDDKIKGTTRIDNPCVIDVDYLLLNHPCFLNSSIMYRKIYADSFLNSKEALIDYFVYIALLHSGKIGFLPESLGVYRAGIGVSSNLNLMPCIEMSIDSASDIVSDESVIERAKAKQYLSYSIAWLLRRDYQKFRSYITKAKKISNNKSVLLIYSLRRFGFVLFIFLKLYKELKAWV